MTSDSRHAAACHPPKPSLRLPLVSIVVVSYNHAPFLRACLDSVVDQTYPHLQLIVVDNASTDASRDLILRFQDELPSLRSSIQFTPVFSAENGHEMGAVIQGFAHVTGSYVAFIDGDDLLLQGCVETHVKAHLVSRIAVGLTSVDMYQSNGDDIVVGTGPLLSSFVMSRRGQTTEFCRMSNLDAFDFAAKSSSQLTSSDLHYVSPSMANEWMWSPSSGLCFRREAVAMMLDPPPKIRAGADNYLVRGISALTGGIAIDRPLAVYRMHGNNMFSRHPALANINSFDLGQRGALDLEVMGAIIDCYRARIPGFAGRLSEPDLFIKAIDHFARVAPNLERRGFSSFTLAFLFDNREALVRAFGLPRYRAWVTRRLRPRDALRFLARRQRSRDRSGSM